MKYSFSFSISFVQKYIMIIFITYNQGFIYEGRQWDLQYIRYLVLSIASPLQRHCPRKYQTSEQNVPIQIILLK